MANNEEIELTDIELKNVVAMANFLPSILSILEEMNKKVSKVDDNLIKQASSLEKFVQSVNSFTVKVDELLKLLKEKNDSDKIDDLSKQIKGLANDISKFQNTVKKPANEGANTNKKDTSVAQTEVKKEEAKKKNVSEKDLTYYNTLRNVLLYIKNKKPLFLFYESNIKRIFSCDSELAIRLIDFFKKNNFLMETSPSLKKIPEVVLDKHIRECNQFIK